MLTFQVFPKKYLKLTAHTFFVKVTKIQQIRFFNFIFRQNSVYSQCKIHTTKIVIHQMALFRDWKYETVNKRILINPNIAVLTTQCYFYFQYCFVWCCLNKTFEMDISTPFDLAILARSDCIVHPHKTKLLCQCHCSENNSDQKSKNSTHSRSKKCKSRSRSPEVFAIVTSSNLMSSSSSNNEGIVIEFFESYV